MLKRLRALLSLMVLGFTFIHPAGLAHGHPLDFALNNVQAFQSVYGAESAAPFFDEQLTQLIQALNSIAQLYNATLTNVATYGPEITEFLSATENTTEVYGPKVIEFMDSFIELYKLVNRSAPDVLQKTFEFMDSFIALKATLSGEIEPATQSLGVAANGLQSIGSLADTISAHPYLIAAGVAATIAAGCVLGDLAKNHIFTLDPAKSLPLKAWRGCCWIGRRLKSFCSWTCITQPQEQLTFPLSCVRSQELQPTSSIIDADSFSLDERSMSCEEI
jgi:hypothetical protein